MAASPITFYLLNSKATGSNFLSLQENGTAPTAVNINGWAMGTVAAGNYSPLKALTEQATTTFTTTVAPDGTLDNTNGDGFRSEGKLSGTFANADWTFTFKVRSATAAYTGRFRFRVRVYKSTSITGASPTELTTSTLVTNTTTANLATASDTTLTITWTPGTTFTLNGEYLFFEVADEITSVGSGATQDVAIRANGTTIVTPNFDGITFRSSTTAAAVAGATSITINKPAGVVSGDVLVAIVNTDDTASSLALSGWQLQSNTSNPATAEVWVLTKVAGGSEPASYTFTWTGSAGASGVMLAYINVDNTTPVDTGTTASTATTSLAYAALTLGNTSERLVYGVADWNSGTVTPPTGVISKASVTVTTIVLSYDEQLTASGSTGTRTFTVPTGGSAGGVIALKQASTGPTTTTLTYTEDLILKALSQSITYTEDLILKALNQTKTYTEDLVLLGRNTSSYTEDTILKALSQTNAYTEDTILKALNQNKTYTEDLILLARNQTAYTEDLILKITNALSYTEDTILKALNQNKNYTEDLILKTTNTNTYTEDLVLQSRNQSSYTEDLLLKGTNTQSYTEDFVLKGLNQSNTYTEDTLLRATNVNAYTEDLILKALNQNATYTEDLILRATNQNSYTEDLLLSQRSTNTYTEDLVLVSAQQVAGQLTYSEEFILKALNQSITYTEDTILSALNQAKTYTEDLILKQENSKTYSEDLILKITNSYSYTEDLVLKALNQLRTYNEDLILKATNNTTYTEDLVLVQGSTTNALTYTEDVLLKTQNTSSYSEDFILADATGFIGSITRPQFLLLVA